MKCREFIMLLIGAAIWPLAARAQQAAILVVGLLSSLFQTLATLAFQRGTSIGNQIRPQAMP